MIFVLIGFSIGKWQMHPTGEYRHIAENCGFDVVFAWHNEGERCEPAFCFLFPTSLVYALKCVCCTFFPHLLPDSSGDRYYKGEFVTNVKGLNKATYSSFDWSSAEFQDADEDPQVIDLTGVYSEDVMLKVAQDVLVTANSNNESLFIYYPLLLPHEKVKAPPGTSHSNQQEGYQNQVTYADGITGQVGPCNLFCKIVF